jgi:hypothetical protein
MWRRDRAGCRSAGDWLGGQHMPNTLLPPPLCADRLRCNSGGPPWQPRLHGVLAATHLSMPPCDDKGLPPAASSALAECSRGDAASPPSLSSAPALHSSLLKLSLRAVQLEASVMGHTLAAGTHGEGSAGWVRLGAPNRGTRGPHLAESAVRSCRRLSMKAQEPPLTSTVASTMKYVADSMICPGLPAGGAAEGRSRRGGGGETAVASWAAAARCNMSASGAGATATQNIVRPTAGRCTMLAEVRLWGGPKLPAPRPEHAAARPPGTASAACSAIANAMAPRRPLHHSTSWWDAGMRGLPAARSRLTAAQQGTTLRARDSASAAKLTPCTNAAPHHDRGKAEVA